MRIFGLVIMSAKRYDEHNAAVDREMFDLKVKIGSLEFDLKETSKLVGYTHEKNVGLELRVRDLQRQLKDAEIHIEHLSEMNAGLWEMKGVSEE